MRIWSVHLRQDRAPVLVREGFCWPAFLFGPFWLFARGAWVPASIGLLVSLALTAWVPDAGMVLVLALAWGFFARDLWRWWLGLRGYAPHAVVAGWREDDAAARLAERHPDLLPRLAGLRPIRTSPAGEAAR